MNWILDVYHNDREYTRKGKAHNTIYQPDNGNRRKKIYWELNGCISDSKECYIKKLINRFK